jgi:ATP-dependent DNA helicase RecG
MLDRDLEALLKDLESDRAERKSSLSDKTDICQAICAFANDLPGNRQPGVCFLGVDDRGRCAGLPITDQLLLTLANFRSDGNLLPFPVISVQKRTLNGCDLAVVVVEPRRRRQCASGDAPMSGSAPVRESPHRRRSAA